jgi:cbb3-type cytochrome oxidase maturation protein
MSTIYIVLPLALLAAAAAVLAFIWSVRSGQFDDLKTPPARMVFDDEDDGSPRRGGGERSRDSG